jgi:hypothetical protein
MLVTAALSIISPFLERPIGLANFICPSTGEYQGQKWEWVGRGVGGRVLGTFGIALEM